MKVLGFLLTVKRGIASGFRQKNGMIRIDLFLKDKISNNRVGSRQRRARVKTGLGVKCQLLSTSSSVQSALCPWVHQLAPASLNY